MARACGAWLCSRRQSATGLCLRKLVPDLLIVGLRSLNSGLVATRRVGIAGGHKMERTAWRRLSVALAAISALSAVSVGNAGKAGLTARTFLNLTPEVQEIYVAG